MDSQIQSHLKCIRGSDPSGTATLVHQIFEAQVRIDPHRIALSYEGAAMTYGDLNCAANRLARYLMSMHVGPESLVGICIERGLDMVTGILAVMKSGGAYVPLDPTYPHDRLAYCLKDTGLRVVLTNSASRNSLPQTTATLIQLDAENAELSRYDDTDIDISESHVRPDNLAYLIYTSGSTGVPKGVMVEHRGLRNYLEFAIPEYINGWGIATVVSSPLGFDATVTSLYCSLLTGNRTVLVPDGQELEGLENLLLQNTRWSLVKISPAHLRALGQRFLVEKPSQTVGAFVIGGEALPPSTVKMWREIWPNVRLINEYGPTETVVGCSTYEIPTTWEESDSVSIGTPILGTHISVLDQDLRPVPPGTHGEMYIGGKGVARGYLNRPDLTAERFLADPSASDASSRMYRSGDLAQLGSDGLLTYCGRNDDQIKIRGFRIEPVEIESTLQRHDSVKDARVLTREDIRGEKRLVAYVIPDVQRMKSDFEGRGTGSEGSADRWKSLHEETHWSAPESPSLESRTSSYTGNSIPIDDMKEWLNRTVERIASYRPDEVLEVGCSSGLLAQHIAPISKNYMATDSSAAVIGHVQDWIKSRPNLNNVSTTKCGATDLYLLQPQSFDMIILNSVVQYFPDLDYLKTVLSQAANLLSHGGRIFLGDLRSLNLLPIMHASVHVERAAIDMRLEEFKRLVSLSVYREHELVIDPRFFSVFARTQPMPMQAKILLKRGRPGSELTKFRYDVVLERAAQVDSSPIDYVDWEPGRVSAKYISSVLTATRTRALRVRGVQNLRLSRDLALAALLRSSDGEQRVIDLRTALQKSTAEGEDPEAYWRLGEALRYDVTIELALGHNDGRFDVTLCDNTQRASVSPLPAGASASDSTEFVSEPPSRVAYSNDPLARQLELELIPNLCAFIRKRLPSYMVPAAFVFADEFRLTANGKLDRDALPAQDLEVRAYREYRAPISEMERVLADIWSETLQVGRIGRSDNFFELGGHSLLMVQMLERLRQRGFSIGLRSVYANPVLSDLALEIVSNSMPQVPVPPNLIPPDCDLLAPEMLTMVQLGPDAIETIVKSVPGGARNIQDVYRLSPLQEGMLFHHCNGSAISGDIYALPMLLSIETRDELQRLISSLQLVVDRHDSLRTSLLWEGLPFPIQVVYRQAPLHIEYVTFEQDDFVQKGICNWLGPNADRMDLKRAPLIKLKVASGPSLAPLYAVLEIHHIICDHESLELMLSEVLAYYRNGAALLEQPLPYRTHIAHVKHYEEAHSAEAFFSHKLGDVNEATAPFGFLDVRGDGSRSVEVRRPLSDELSVLIREQARAIGVGAATIFHAAWGLVVSRITGRDDVVYGTVLLGRQHLGSQSAPTLGMFLNTLPLRLRLHDVTAVQLVEQTQRELIDLLSHEQASLSLAQRCSGVPPSLPLFSSLLNFIHGVPSRAPERAQMAPGIKMLASPERTNYPITLSIEDHGERFVLCLLADHRIDPENLIRYTSVALLSLARALNSSPDRPALSLEVLPESEQQEIIRVSSGARTDFPCEQRVDEVLEDWSVRTPDAIAAASDGRTITFAELNATANRLAHYLVAKGARFGDCIPILMPRSLLQLISQLAVLKVGAAYVPIDPNLPIERQTFIVRDCGARHILANFPRGSHLHGEPQQWIDCDDVVSNRTALPVTNLGAITESAGDRPAYVMYTSGSTGAPKGVVVPHRAVVRLAINNGYASIQPTDCIAHCSNPAFDASTFEVWGALLNGARTAIVPHAVVLDAVKLSEYLIEHGVTVLWLTIGLLDEHAGALKKVFPRLKYLLTGGDVVDPALVNRVLDFGRPNVFLNAYGPTECTTFTTTYSIQLTRQANGIPIGRPLSNAQVYIMDKHRRLLPTGAVGEIYIGGAGVSLGYLNRHELTKECFFADPYCSDGKGLMYKTGDLGLWRADGNLEFHGRIDDQVKIRGFRIEPAEIEEQLRRHSQIEQAVVATRRSQSGDKRLIAYVVEKPPAGKGELDDSALRTFLMQRIPSYMIPSAFVRLDRLPLNLNGKVDRRNLPEPISDARSDEQRDVPEIGDERALASLWCELLQVPAVRRSDNFFELGGHSLLALKLKTKIRAEFGTELPIADIYQNPILTDQCARICGAVTGSSFVDLSKESTLPRDLVVTPDSPRANSANIMLTGATGFVGRFLLNELLLKTPAIVYCLVRASSREDALRRVKDTLLRWGLWRSEFDGRVIGIAGDLRLSRFGLDDDSYGALATDVGAVYHCATSMNHLETYEMAKSANVDGCLDILRFSADGRLKVLNFVSTLSVFSPFGASARRVIDESTPTGFEKHRTSEGYAASKWVGESMIIEAHRRGFACNIFRLGLIWADSVQGRYDELQREYRIVNSCFTLGCGIQNYGFEASLTPVDYAARAIVHLGMLHRDGGGIFHISMQGEPESDFFERCNKVTGLNLNLVSQYDWVRSVDRSYQSGVSLPALPIVEFAFNMSEVELNAHQQTHSLRNMSFDNSRTRAELERSGIASARVSDDQIRVFISRMLESDSQFSDSWGTRSKSAAAS